MVNCWLRTSTAWIPNQVGDDDSEGDDDGEVDGNGNGNGKSIANSSGVTPASRLLIMQSTLLAFISALRDHEVRVSTAESLDAMRVLALVGYQDRQTLKQALAATLAKTIEEKPRFEHCFELFYGGERLRSPANISTATLEQSSPDNDFATAQQHDTDAQNTALEDARPSTDPGIQQAIDKPLVKLLLTQNNASQISAEVARAIAKLDTDQLRYFTQTGQYTRKLLDTMGSAQLNNSIDQLRDIDNSAANTLADIIDTRRSQLRDTAKQAIEEQLLLTAHAEGRTLKENVLRNARLSSLERQHFNELKELVRKLSKKLAAKHSRRQRLEKRGRLDVAKTLRKNIHNDGILFDTYWKKKRKDQPKLIALCDISNSVAAYAKFLLLFLYSLNDVLPKVRSFCFSNRSGEVSELFTQYEAADALDRAFELWGRGSSDYGQSLLDFSEACLDTIDSNTTVIILGDARNNRGDPRLDIMRAIYKRSKTVIWLNPERRSHWHTGDSEMQRYQSCSHFVAECQSLRQLERIVDQLLKLSR